MLSFLFSLLVDIFNNDDRRIYKLEVLPNGDSEKLTNDNEDGYKQLEGCCVEDIDQKKELIRWLP
jgi:hypothetical protein